MHELSILEIMTIRSKHWTSVVLMLRFERAKAPEGGGGLDCPSIDAERREKFEARRRGTG